MKTDITVVYGDGRGMSEALDKAEDFSRAVGLDEKSARRARLLAEETMSMVSSVVGDFQGDFWMESKGDQGYELHLVATADIDCERKEELIAASTSGRNEASVGIMGKIKDFIEYNLFYMGKGVTLSAGSYHLLGYMNSPGSAQIWSLEQYRQDVKNADETHSDMDELLDELEKSIVANIADDVKVAVKGNEVRMVISKKCGTKK